MPIKVKVGGTWTPSKTGDVVSEDKLVGKVGQALNGPPGYNNNGASGCTSSTCSYSCIGKLSGSCGSCEAACSNGCGNTCKWHCNFSCTSGSCPSN